MIQYNLFTFACPPHTAADWFIKASQSIGLGPGFRHHAYEQFQGTAHSQLRVSLVRHPCSWLGECWLSLRKNEVESNHTGYFSMLPKDTFHQFVQGYLAKDPGSISRLYNRYEADTCIRVEDLPWAFLELAESLGVPEVMLSKARRLVPPVQAVQLPDHLHRQVIDAEREVVESYDYW